jgi:hypothetical protein
MFHVEHFLGLLLVVPDISRQRAQKKGEILAVKYPDSTA